MTLAEEFIKLSMFPDQVTDPELFLERLYAIETHEDREEMVAMIQEPSSWQKREKG